MFDQELCVYNDQLGINLIRENTQIYHRILKKYSSMSLVKCLTHLYHFRLRKDSSMSLWVK